MDAIDSLLLVVLVVAVGTLAVRVVLFHVERHLNVSWDWLHWQDAPIVGSLIAAATVSIVVLLLLNVPR